MAEEYVIVEVVGDDGCPGDPIELRGSDEEGLLVMARPLP